YDAGAALQDRRASGRAGGRVRREVHAERQDRLGTHEPRTRRQDPGRERQARPRRAEAGKRRRALTRAEAQGRSAEHVPAPLGQHCKTVERPVERVVADDVKYTLIGKTDSVRMNREPGDRIPVENGKLVLDPPKPASTGAR